MSRCIDCLPEPWFTIVWMIIMLGFVPFIVWAYWKACEEIFKK